MNWRRVENLRTARMSLAFLFILGLSAIPLLTGDHFLLNTLILAHIYAVYVLGWDLLAGTGGQVSGGHALSFGAAAYISALLGMAGLHFSLVIPLAVLFTTALGLLVGVLFRRQSGAYLILVTLAIAEIAHELSLNLSIKTTKGYAIGGEGGIPVLTAARGTEAFYLESYYLSLLVLLLSIGLLFLFTRSISGLKLKAVAGDPMVAQAIGLSPGKYKVIAFGISFFLGGLAGVMYGHYMGVAAPSTLSIEQSFAAMVLSIVGGKGTFIGPAAAAYLLTAVFSLFWIPPVVRLLLYSLILIVASLLIYGKGLRLLPYLHRIKLG